MLTERTVVDQITILEDGQIQVRRVDKVFNDGVEIAKSSPHRHVVAPGDDLSKEDPRVRAHAELAHTPKVIAEFRRKAALGGGEAEEIG